MKEGVYVEPPYSPCSDFKTRVWTLVDADNHAHMPSHLMEATTRHLLIFTTPPQSERWKRLEKYTSPVIYIMNPWSKKEILRACVDSSISTIVFGTHLLCVAPPSMDLQTSKWLFAMPMIGMGPHPGFALSTLKGRGRV